jgi:hypothetical protein
VLGTLASQLTAVIAGGGPSADDQQFAALGRQIASLVEARHG